jgi:AraC-like DNA-binding protein
MGSFNINIAQQLLSNNSIYISEVAYSIGFNDPKYFSRCFKKVVGVSPKKYRDLTKTKYFLSDNKQIDSIFLEKAISTLEAKISVGNISFEEFACEMNVSKAYLYRKLKTISGLSPSKFILSVRINRSTQLLNTYRNVSDVAFAVGFNDSKYFSRCFKKKIGISPKYYLETGMLSEINNNTKNYIVSN